MSTRGTAYFEIQYEHDKEPVRVGKICIRFDAYPEGFGKDICNIILSAYIADAGAENSTDKPIGTFFPNVERVILHILDVTPSDFYVEKEFVYRFIFQPYNNNSPICQVGKILHVEVKPQYEDDFSGSFAEFLDYCAPKW